MRDKRFVAEHRGGPLKPDQHKQLIIWACACAEHVLPLLGGEIDERLLNALSVAHEWERGKVPVGYAMKASRDAHTVARESSDPVRIAVARAIGHAVATAHMADHSLGSALYALKAIRISGNPVDQESDWQINRVPFEIRELVVTAMIRKKEHFTI